ncbi:hypothetical protein Tco_1183353 [Tanacetum coccineum]
MNMPKHWNDWYKKCEECKYDKISYDKAYNDMQQKIEWLQAQLGDDSSFQSESILGKPTNLLLDLKLYALTHHTYSYAYSKVVRTNALSKPVTSNSVPSSRESTVVNNERVIAPGIFRINPFKATRVDNFVPNKHVKTSVRTKPIIVSQSHVITKNDVNSKTNGFSPKDSRSTTRTRRPKPWNNPKSDKVHFKSKSGCLSNKLEKIEENHRSLQSSHYPNRTESEKSSTALKGSVRFSALYLKKKRNLLVFTSVDMIVMTSMVELESLFGHLFDELSNGENQVVTKSSAVTTADASDKCQQQQDSTSSTSTLATTITADGNFDL